MYQATKRRKVVECQPIAVDVWARLQACGKSLKKKKVIRTGNKFYIPSLPYTYKETELSEDLNDGM